MTYPTGSASIYPEDEPPFEDELYPSDDADCDHEDYDLDWGTGRAICERCSHSWYLTDEQFRQHCEWAARVAEDFDDTPSLWARTIFWPLQIGRRIAAWAMSRCDQCEKPNRFLGIRIGDHAGHVEEIPF